MTKLPPAPDIDFPISALALARSASDRLENQTEAAQQRMVKDLLPRTVSVILTQQQHCRSALKGLSSDEMERLIRGICQILWSQPGSIGGTRIEQLLIGVGLDPEIADEVATYVYKYSRHSVSIINLIRHYKSAINGVSDMVDPIRFNERFMRMPGLSPTELSKWPEQVTDFGDRVFKNSSDVAEWLNECELFITEVISASSKARKKEPQKTDVLSWQELEKARSSVAMAYTRRYGRFITQEFPAITLSGRYLPSSRSDSDSIIEQLERLEMELTGDDRKVFGLLEEFYEKNSNRIVSLKRPSSSLRLARNATDFTYTDQLINTLKFDGKNLTIKHYPEQISGGLIDQLIRVFDAQLEVESRLPIFESSVSKDGQTLSIELENPAMRDSSNLRKLLMRLLNTN